jgi:hypothetical protein
LDGVSFQEARALERPATTIVRGQLRTRLSGRQQPLALAAPGQRRRPGDIFL